MIRAEFKDKKRIVDMLTSSFDENSSVNYIIKQDKKRTKRIEKLMEYSFDVCYLFGKVLLSDDKKGCALIVLPEKKKTTFKSILLNLKLVLFCVGLSNAKKTMDREAKIKKFQPREPMYYLWFIGVEPNEQNKGIGSALLTEIIKESESEKRIICLETSTLKNLPWYQKFGFTIYNELHLEYKLFFLKRETG
ncbi:MAG: GNAT family N-acetyltransferase [Chitinophagaceae bacterium]